MTALNATLAAITGLRDPLHEQRDVLRFPTRKIVVIPHDPIARATNAVKDGADDFMFAIAEAFNAKDAEGLAQLRAHIAHCTEAMRVCEAMAADFSARMFKE